jgi:hypothetical protein
VSAANWAVVLAVLITLTVVLGIVVAYRTRRWSVVSFFASVATILVVVVAQGDPVPTAVKASAPIKTTSLATVLSQVKASNAINTVPPDLDPPLSVAVTEPTSNFGGPTTACQPAIPISTAPTCEFGDRNGSHTMVLYGDSHAAMWFEVFNQIALRAHWRLFILTKGACPAEDVPTRTPDGIGEWTTCDQWHHFAIARIRQIHPDLLVVTQKPVDESDGTPYPSPQWRMGLERLLRLIPKVKKIVLGNIPKSQGPDCIAEHTGDVQACSSDPKALSYYNDAEKQAATAEGARYIDVTPWFCAVRCSPIIGDHDVYFNAGHIATDYSLFLEGVLAQKLDL